MHDARDAEDTRLLAGGEYGALVESYYETIIQAPVVLVSMASSTAEDAPRGIGFAFDRHRVNVATSHAQCRVVLVCAPRLLDADCKAVEQMRLVNAVCRFVELADPV